MTHMRCVSVGPGREDFFWHTCVSDVWKDMKRYEKISLNNIKQTVSVDEKS